MTPGERIRAEIQAQGRLQSWVAAQMGISQSYLTKLLAGKRDWLPHLREAVARALGVPETALFLPSDCLLSDDAICQDEDTESA